MIENFCIAPFADCTCCKRTRPLDIVQSYLQRDRFHGLERASIDAYCGDVTYRHAASERDFGFSGSLVF